MKVFRKKLYLEDRKDYLNNQWVKASLRFWVDDSDGKRVKNGMTENGFCVADDWCEEIEED